METIANVFQAEIFQRIGWTLVHFVWQAAAIGMVLAITLKLLHKSSANLRYITACIGLALIVLLPAVTIRMIDVAASPVRQTIVDLPKTVVDAGPVVEIPAIELPPVAMVQTLPKVALKDRFIAAVEPALPYLVISWFIGVFGLSLWHLGGFRQLQKLRRQMVKQVEPRLREKLQRLAETLGITKAVGLMESALVQVPTVIGHLRPVILLPVSALTGLNPEQIEAILAHELAHIKRHDYLVNMLQTVVEILGFYHPAVWWVSKRIRVERENCCDDIAVSICSDKICYAKALTTLEEIRAGQIGLAVAANGGSLFDRIRRLLGKDTANESKLTWLPSVLAILLIISLIIPTTLALSSKSNIIVLPATSFIDKNGSIVDKIDYPFVNDPQVVGGWKSVDFVKDINDFVPDKKSFRGDLFLKELFFLDGGKTNWAFSWTKGLVLQKGDKTASKYIFKEIGGTEYMFMEWKSGDYVIRHRKPDYYVLKKEKDMVYVESRTIDKIDYPFVNDSNVIGKWESVDFVDTIDQFKAGQKQWKWSDLFLTEMTFSENGDVTLKNSKAPNGYNKKWTKSLVLDEDEKTASKYTLKKVDDSIYMFYEWKSGDYTIRQMKPKYYVLKKTTENLAGKSKDEKPDNKESYRSRHFVRLVVGENEITFQGKKTTWDKLDNLLEKVDHRNITVLEVGFTEFSKKRNDVSTDQWLREHDQWQKAAQLREKFGFEYLSFVGQRELGDVAGGTRNYLVRPMEFSREIDVNLPSAEDKPSVQLNMIEFSKDKAVIKANVTSYPKAKWDIEIAFFDQEMKRLDYVFKKYENSGVIKGTAFVSKERIEVDISKIKDIDKTKFFELSIKQAENRDQDNLIVPGVRVGKYKFYISKNDVLESLGKPKMIFCGETRYTLDNLPEIYYMVFDDICFRIQNDSVAEITALSPTYKFTNGMGVGSFEQEIKQAFGDNFSIKEDTSKDFLRYKDKGLEFEIDKNNRKVMEINVSKIYDPNIPQTLTKGYFIEVPPDMPELKEMISLNKSEFFPPEKLEEFLKVVEATPGARILAKPKLIANDGETGEIKTESNKESLKIKIINHVRPDKKDIQMDIDFVYSFVNDNNDKVQTNVTTNLTVLSDHAIALGVPKKNGMTLLFIVQPQILEKPVSQTGVVASDGLKSEKEASKKDEIEMTARFLLVPADACEIKDFFQEQSVKNALVNTGGDPNTKSYLLNDAQVEKLRLMSDAKQFTAPKVTVLNGESATFSSSRVTRFGDPNEEEKRVVEAGIKLQAKPTLQEGGKSILLDFEFEVTDLIGFVDGLPQTEKTQIKSRIAVPDGGTFLIGGMKMTEDKVGKMKMTEEKDGKKIQKALLCLIKAVKLKSDKPSSNN